MLYEILNIRNKTERKLESICSNVTDTPVCIKLFRRPFVRFCSRSKTILSEKNKDRVGRMTNG